MQEIECGGELESGAGISIDVKQCRVKCRLEDCGFLNDVLVGFKFGGIYLE